VGQCVAVCGGVWGAVCGVCGGVWGAVCGVCGGVWGFVAQCTEVVEVLVGQSGWF
jgi:hypothetical protein